MRFASCHATLHVPWWSGGEDGETVTGSSSTEDCFEPAAFRTLTRAWSDPSARRVRRARCWECHDVVRNTVSTAKQRRAATTWRARAADEWLETEPGAAPAFQADTRPDAPQHDAETEAALDAVVEELRRAAEASVGGAADQSAPRRAHLEEMGEVFVGLRQPGPEHDGRAVVRGRVRVRAWLGGVEAGGAGRGAAGAGRGARGGRGRRVAARRQPRVGLGERLRTLPVRRGQLGHGAGGDGAGLWRRRRTRRTHARDVDWWPGHWEAPRVQDGRSRGGQVRVQGRGRGVHVVSGVADDGWHEDEHPQLPGWRDWVVHRGQPG